MLEEQLKELRPGSLIKYESINYPEYTGVLKVTKAPKKKFGFAKVEVSLYYPVEEYNENILFFFSSQPKGRWWIYNKNITIFKDYKKLIDHNLKRI